MAKLKLFLFAWLRQIGLFTFCMLGNFWCFCCHLLTFFKISFFKIFFFSSTIRVSNCWDPEQDRRCVGPDLDQNCLQMLSIDDKYLRMQGKS